MERGKGAGSQPPASHYGRPPLTLRYPRLTLLVTLIVLVALGIFGLNVGDKLKPTSLEIPGSDAAEANQLLEEHFGDSAPFAVLLQGPPKALDRQGPRLIGAMREDPAVTTLSPWDRGRLGRLRPEPNTALIIANFHVDVEEAVRETVPQLNATLEEEIRPPVEYTQTGFATLSRAIQDESIAATHRGELIALPILLIVLMLVFRSPIAAAVPLLCGGLVVFGSRGILSYLTGSMSIDGFALVVCTMMGLALGIDYALLMVSRFREEMRGGAKPLDAAWTTRRTSGRTVIFAASTLILSMAVAMLVLPGALLVSLAGTVIMVTGLSALVALLAGPAILILLGTRVDMWQIGGARTDDDRTGLMVVVNGALRNPALAAGFIAVFLILMAAPAIGLKTGPPSPEQLPQDNQVRLDTEKLAEVMGPGWDAPFTIVVAAENGPITAPQRFDRLVAWQDRIARDPAVQAVMGPGWDAPFTIVVAAENGPITAPQRFDRLVAWQDRIARDPAVQAVVGPSEVAERTEPLSGIGPALLDPETGPLADLTALGRQLGRASGGVAQLRQG